MSKHSKERAKERYNIELTDVDEICIKQLIKEGKSKFLYNSEENHNKKFCYVVYKNIPFKVLYNRSKKNISIITIYPFDADEYNRIIDEEHEKKIKQFNSRIEKAIAFLKVNGYIVYKRKGEDNAG